MARIEELEDQVAALEASLGGAVGVAQAFEGELSRMREQMVFTGREVDRLSTGIGYGLRRAFDGLVFDGMKLSDALEGVARTMADTVYAVAMKPVQNAVGGVLAQGMNALLSGALPFAEGGAFSAGRVMPFARGGVVSGAVEFPMRGGRGVMGEAGPEAILPLARGADGRLYGGRMVDMARAHVWAWDARPFPQFPALQDVWSDAANYGRGHWLSGRASAQPLASVVAEICERSGVPHFDVSGLYGVVRGYAVTGIGSARAALQPLMLAHGFEALERDGLLIFRMRDARPAAVLDPERLAVISELEGAVETTRAAEAEMAGRVRLDYIEAEGEYAIRQAEAIFPDEVSLGVSQSDLPMTLAAAEARGIAERWLSEARVARDLARFALPPSALPLGA
ncbi:hypothetical protein FAZ78_17330, partial [Cereibacter changlensis]